MHFQPRVSKAGIYALLIAPAFLNDFTNIYIANYETWVIVDYAIRLAQLAAVVYFVKQHLLSWADVGLGNASFIRVLNYAIVLGIVAYTVGSTLLPYLKTILPADRLATIPYDPNSPLFDFDMTAGLFLVGLSEEVVSRGLGFVVFKEKYGTVKAYFFSSIVFGLMHWSNGLPGVVNSIAIGLIYCIAPHRTGVVWSTVLAHILYNILYYNGF